MRLWSSNGRWIWPALLKYDPYPPIDELEQLLDNLSNFVEPLRARHGIEVIPGHLETALEEVINRFQQQPAAQEAMSPHSYVGDLDKNFGETSKRDLDSPGFTSSKTRRKPPGTPIQLPISKEGSEDAEVELVKFFCFNFSQGKYSDRQSLATENRPSLAPTRTQRLAWKRTFTI